MNSIESLTSAHVHTYQTIFQHPISHNLQWRDVRSLLEKLGQFMEEPNGNLKVSRHGQSLALHPPRTKGLEDDERMALQHFLDKSDAAALTTGKRAVKCLLVIDHHEARIFRIEKNGAAMQQILPPNPEDFFRHAPDSKDFSRGKEKSDPHNFLGPVVKALQSAEQVLIFSRGTGMSSEMDQFVAWAKTHLAQLARRIVGKLVVNEKQMTEGQLLAKAREFYATPVSLRP